MRDRTWRFRSARHERRPATVAELREAVRVIKGLAGGQEVEHRGTRLRLSWNPRSSTPVWVAAYGPKVLAVAGEAADGYILQLADPAIVE